MADRNLLYVFSSKEIGRSRTEYWSSLPAGLPNAESVFRMRRAVVLHLVHSLGVKMRGTSSALTRFMSAALSKLLMMVRNAHAGSALTRSLILSRGVVARSTQK